MIALVDCNSFYCSCERVFNPGLNRRPVIVLSNNDGCAVARTEEAKKLGIKMGAPYYKIKDFCDRNNVSVFSSNYTLYGDMSRRVMNILSDYTAEMEIYSIDEAFIVLNSTVDHHSLGVEIRQKVFGDLGLPVCVGIGPTKVLAKMANQLAKRYPHSRGSFVLKSDNLQELENFPVERIWGIGKKSALKLRAAGIHSALDLKNADEKFILKTLTIVGHRILRELNGEACIELELTAKEKQGIMSSRSFGRPVFTKVDLKEAVATHITTAAAKLRTQDCLARYLSVFIRTNPLKSVTQYNGESYVTIPNGTSSTGDLIAHAHKVLDQIFRAGIEYKKCGVSLGDFIAVANAQLGLFGEQNDTRKDDLMVTLDLVNKRFGRGTLKFAASGLNVDWDMISKLRSKRYTTRWDELLTVS